MEQILFHMEHLEVFYSILGDVGAEMRIRKRQVNPA